MLIKYVTNTLLMTKIIIHCNILDRATISLKLYIY